MKKCGWILLIGILFFATLIDSKALAKEILINVPAKELLLVDNGIIVNRYRVALGKVNTQTPIGNFKVVEKLINPTWINPEDLKNVIPSGPANPLGYRWIGIGGHYGIHGTIQPSSIGKYASNGCIRMHEKDVEDLYKKINLGTKVAITYNTMIVKANKEGVIGFILYPDAYGKKAISAEGLYGEINKQYPEVKNFISVESLRKLIKAAGYGHFQEVIRPVKVYDENSTFQFKGYEYNYVLYLPLAEVAQVAKTYYNVNDNVVTTKLGSGEVKVFNNRYYIPLTTIRQVFPLYYGFENKDIVLSKTNNAWEEQYPVDITPINISGDGKDYFITKSSRKMDAHVKRLKGED